jgi:hypothetical protein
LHQAIRLISKLRKAYADAKELPQLLERHQNKLEFVLAIVRAIEDEDALQTITVIGQLNSVCDIVRQVKDCLRSLERDFGRNHAIKEMLHQLLKGKKDARSLADLMNDLDDAKTNLGLVIQLANIGLVKSIENSRELLADPEIIMQADQVLIDVFGEGGGLQLAKLIKGRTPRGLILRHPLIKQLD